MSEDAVVMPISGDICSKPFQPAMIRTTAIRWFREYCIVTSCLSTNAATRQRNCLICRFTDAARRIRSRMDRTVTYIRNRKDTLMTYLEDGRPGNNTPDAEFQDLAPWSGKANIEYNKKSE